MHPTDDPRRTILFFIENHQQLVNIKVDLEKGLVMTQADNPVDFVNKVMSGERGMCLNTDLTVVYIHVYNRSYKVRGETHTQHILSIVDNKTNPTYLFR